MYAVHHDATSLPVELSAPRYVLGKGSVPSLHASASRDARGVLHLSIVNLDPNRPADVTLRVSGAAPKRASGRTLTAPSMTALNDFDAPPNVQPAPLSGVQLESGRFRVSLPSKSVTVLTLE
jgi:alpha-N-arabinofuranosidase